MEKVTIELEKFKEILSECYDAGWSGCKELKEFALQKLLESHKEDVTVQDNTEVYGDPTIFTISSGGAGYSGPITVTGFAGGSGGGTYSFVGG